MATYARIICASLTGTVIVLGLAACSESREGTLDAGQDAGAPRLDGGSDATPTRDASADVAGDAGFESGGDVVFDAGSDAGVDAGCVEGVACAGGICHLDACCTGCWDGAACRSGTERTACGGGGSACVSCDDAHACSGDSCEMGACVNAPLADGAACGGGRECWSDACSFVFQDPLARPDARGHVSLGPDATGDGVPDVALSWGVASAPPIPMPQSTVELRSGVDGSLVWTAVVDEQEVYGGGVHVALGPDADGDGLGDVLVSGAVSPTGSAVLLTGTDGTAVASWTGDGTLLVGESSFLADDYNGDSLADPAFMVRSPGFSWVLEIRSAADRSLIRSIPLLTNLSHSQLSAGGDANGDGVEDVVAMSALSRSPQVFSGATGASLGVLPGVGGFPVAIGPDLDGDGAADVVYSVPPDLVAISVSSTEQWRVPLSGAYMIDIGPDVDGDSLADVAVCQITSELHLALRAGTTGAVLRSWDRQVFDVSLGPDTDGDGLADVAYMATAFSALSPSREW